MSKPKTKEENIKQYTEFYTKKWNEGKTTFKGQQINPRLEHVEMIEVEGRFEIINDKVCLIIPSQINKIVLN